MEYLFQDIKYSNINSYIDEIMKIDNIDNDEKHKIFVRNVDEILFKFGTMKSTHKHVYDMIKHIIGHSLIHVPPHSQGRYFDGCNCYFRLVERFTRIARICDETNIIDFEFIAHRLPNQMRNTDMDTMMISYYAQHKEIDKMCQFINVFNVFNVHLEHGSNRTYNKLQQDHSKLFEFVMHHYVRYCVTNGINEDEKYANTHLAGHVRKYRKQIVEQQTQKKMEDLQMEIADLKKQLSDRDHIVIGHTHNIPHEEQGENKKNKEGE